MTDQQLEERLRSWFRPMADEAPSSTLQASVAAIPDRIPVPPGWRDLFRARPVLVLAAAAAALAVVVVLGALVFFRPLTSDVANPTQTATGPLPTPTTAPARLLAPLGYQGAGTITFVRFDPSIGGNATWLIDPDGTHESALHIAKNESGTLLPWTGCCAVFSPDGRTVAVGYDNLYVGTNAGTWTNSRILKLDGSDVSFIPFFCGGCGSTMGVNYVPRAWSRDAKLIAVEVWNDAMPASDGINVAPTCTVGCTNGDYTCAPDGCDWNTQVTGAHRDVPVGFSPDGTRLLFVRVAHDRLGTLMELTITGGAVREIAPKGSLVFADDYFGPAASYSADGSQIAFAATDTSGDVGQMRIFVRGSTDTSATPLTAPAAFVTTAKWSPDGTWISYDRPLAGTGIHDLVLVHPDGSGETNLTADFAPGICCARWSSDSSALLAAGTEDRDDQSELFIVPINGDPIAQVTTVPALYVDYSWGPASR